MLRLVQQHVLNHALRKSRRRSTMKKYSILALSVIFPLQAEVTHHSALLLRTLFQSSSPERISGFRLPQLLQTPNCYGAYVQAVPLGGRSTKPDKLARHFLPFDRTTLQVVEGTEFNPDTDQPTIIARDIDPAEFNVVTVNNAFRSTLSFRPRQQFVGAGFDYLQILTWDCSGVPRWWGELSFVVKRVENNLHFCEKIEDASCGSIGTGFFSSMTEAFDQPQWRFGKIIRRSLKKTGVDDLELKIGYNFINDTCLSMQAYLGGIFATGNRPHARFLFEPVVGNNKHFGILFGTDTMMNICASDCYSINYAINMTGRYLFRNQQCRSFDLKDKSWSKYMLIYESATDALESSTGVGDRQRPGINRLTLKARVKPGFEGTMTNALIGYYNNCSAEVGYNIYARQSEKVEPCSSISGIALADISGNGTTNPARTINHQYILFANQFTANNYHPLSNTDIDRDSATAPAVLSHTIYAYAGYQWDTCWYPVNLGIGGSYEFTRENSILNKFIVWGKLIAAF